MHTIRNVRWDITGKCNLKCKHCQASMYKYSSILDLKTEEIKLIIDKLEGIQSIGLLGGEPLIRSDILEILEYMKYKNIAVTINTNGTLLDEKLIKSIAPYVSSFSISVDGVTDSSHDKLRGKGSFDKAIHGINLLNKNKNNYNYSIGISYVINKYNLSEVDKIKSFFNKLDVDQLLIDIVGKIGEADKNSEELLLTDEEVLKCAEILVSDNKDINYEIKYKFISNYAIDYINDKFNIKLDYNFVCEAPGVTSIFIRNDGIVYPVQAFAYKKIEGINENLSLIHNNIEDILKKEYFVNYTSLYSKKLYKNVYEPCKTCNHSGKICNPSPTAYILGEISPIYMCKNIYNKKMEVNYGTKSY